MIRDVAAVVVGLIVGMAVNIALVNLNLVLFPMPEGVTFEDAEGLATYMTTLPLQAFLLIIVAHLGQAFVGGWVAARISTDRPMAVALIVGGLSLAGGVANMMMMPLPWWMWMEIPLYLVVAWIAGNLVLQCRAKKASAP